MDVISAFRGVSGETVRLFARIRTLLTVIPAMILSILLAMVTIKLGEVIGLPNPIPAILSVLSIAPVVGAYAVAAKSGDLEGGLSYLFSKSEEIVPFIIRYCVITLAYGSVTALGFYLLFSKAANLSFFYIMSASQVMMIFAALLLVVFAVLASFFSVIICVASDSVGEMFTSEKWGWLLSDRRGDLPPFFAAYFGGMILFFIITVPILLLIVAFLFLFDVRLGIMGASISYAIPFAAAPVLLGRLSGAFVVAEDAAFMGTEEGASSPASPSSIKEEYNAQKSAEELMTLAETNLQAAIGRGKELAAQNPASAEIFAQLCKLYMRAGKEGDVVSSASRAIENAFGSGKGPLASEVFLSIGQRRKGLKLDPKLFERLGRALVVGRKIDEAVWCFMMVIKSGGEELKAQKGIVSAAETAAQEKDIKKAMAVYSYFIKIFPDSEYAGYCQTASKKLRDMGKNNS